MVSNNDKIKNKLNISECRIFILLFFFHIIRMFLIFNLKNLNKLIHLTTNSWWVEVFLHSTPHFVRISLAHRKIYNLSMTCFML
jgi:hypothetical protein